MTGNSYLVLCIERVLNIHFGFSLRLCPKNNVPVFVYGFVRAVQPCGPLKTIFQGRSRFLKTSFFMKMFNFRASEPEYFLIFL